MIQAIRHVGIVVADLQQALNFWCDVLHFDIVRELEESGPIIDAMMGLKNAKLTTVKLSTQDGSMVELLYFHSHPDQPIWRGKPFSTGITHIALTVADIDNVTSKIKQVGGNLPGEPQISLDGKVKVVYASAPDGVLLELVEPLQHR